MSKRKIENAYPGDTKRFSVPLPDFSVPPPGFSSSPYSSQSYTQSWYPSPPQQPYGLYNYNSTEASPSFPTPGANFPWNNNKHRAYQNGRAARSSIGNVKPRGRGRGGTGRSSEPFNPKSPRNTPSASGTPWFQESSNVNSPNSRYSNNHFSNELDRQIETIDDKSDSKKTIVNKKGKRKSMSQKYSSKPWDLESAEKAVAVELEYNRLQNTQSLILKFPDAELNKDIVKTFNNSIEHVHFQQPSTPRYCFVQLCEGADVDEVQNQLKEVTFGGGKISVERKTNQKTSELAPEKIDPYTLYVGNLPTNITAETVKAIYPTAFRVDIGYAQKMKYTRYAFISYQTAEAAIKAFKDTHSLSLDSRSIIVRFRRHKGAVGLPGQSKALGDQPDEIASNNRANPNSDLKKKSKTSLSEDDDVISVEINDAPVEIDEDDYYFPYQEEIDDHYNSDCDDTLFENLESLSRENQGAMNKFERNASSSNVLNKSNLSASSLKLNQKSKLGINDRTNKTKAAENNSKSSNDRPKSNITSELENLKECLIPPVHIKEEPPERDDMDEFLDNDLASFTDQLATAASLATIKEEPVSDRVYTRKSFTGKVPMPIALKGTIKQEPDTESSSQHNISPPVPTPFMPLPISMKMEPEADSDITKVPNHPAPSDLVRKMAAETDSQSCEDFDIAHLMSYVTQENSALEQLSSDEQFDYSDKSEKSYSVRTTQSTISRGNMDFSDDDEDDTDYTAYLGEPVAPDFLNT